MIKPANGTTGHLLRGPDGHYCFRVYDEFHNFTDYDLQHFDLMVTICDKDAAFYINRSGGAVLDHLQEILGIKNG